VADGYLHTSVAIEPRCLRCHRETLTKVTYIGTPSQGGSGAGIAVKHVDGSPCSILLEAPHA
jgi:hypothetical protein